MSSPALPCSDVFLLIFPNKRRRAITILQKILVVDDEIVIIDVIQSYLEKAGYQVVTATNGVECMRQFILYKPDLVILDLMLPDHSGEDLCKTIRAQSDVAVIMVTAKSSINSRIRGLSLGADDYLIKPFDPRELITRVKTVLRRTEEHRLLAYSIEWDDGKLIIDDERHKVFARGEELSLTSREYDLLVTLARHPGRVWTRDELVVRAFGFQYEGDLRTIDAFIKTLRQKLEENPRQPRYVHTVYGVGYRFEVKPL